MKKLYIIPNSSLAELLDLQAWVLSIWDKSLENFYRTVDGIRNKELPLSALTDMAHPRTLEIYGPLHKFSLEKWKVLRPDAKSSAVKSHPFRQRYLAKKRLIPRWLQITSPIAGSLVLNEEQIRQAWEVCDRWEEDFHGSLPNFLACGELLVAKPGIIAKIPDFLAHFRETIQSDLTKFRRNFWLSEWAGLNHPCSETKGPLDVSACGANH